MNAQTHIHFHKTTMKLRTKIEGKEYESKRDVPVSMLEGFIELFIEFQEVKKSSYSRQEVLSELWIPQLEFACWIITTEHRIQASCFHYQAEITQLQCFNYRFAPTYDLALEIVQIRLGKWLPKKGDRVWYCHNGNWGTKFAVNAKHFNDSYWNDSDLAENIICFPSAAQRQTFIEKNKPKEEPGEDKEITFDSWLKKNNFTPYIDERGFLRVLK